MHLVGQEEEEQRRLETLKKQRDQRIVARNSRSPVTPNQRMNRLPAKRISPNLTFPAKSTIGVPGRVNHCKGAAQAASRLTRSLSSLPDVAKRKEEGLGAASQPKRAFQAGRRMSEPKESFSQRISSSFLTMASDSRTLPTNSVSREGGGQCLSTPLRSAVRSGQTHQYSCDSKVRRGQSQGRRPSIMPGSAGTSGQDPPRNSSASKGHSLLSSSRSAISNGQTPPQKSSTSKGSGGRWHSSLRSTLSSRKSPPQNSSPSIVGSVRRLSSPSRKSLANPITAARTKSTGKSRLTAEIKAKKTTEKKKALQNTRNFSGDDEPTDMGNRFPQAEAMPPVNEEIQPSSSSAIMHEEVHIETFHFISFPEHYEPMIIFSPL